MKIEVFDEFGKNIEETGVAGELVHSNMFFFYFY
jgi:hypothetical protein